MYVITAYYPVHGSGRHASGQGFHAGDNCATPARYPVHHATGPTVTGAAGRKVSAIHGGAITLTAASDAFLSTPRMSNPNTRRAYAGAIDRAIAVLGQLWGGSAEATWNRNRAAIGSWLTWCQTRKRWPAPSVPADCERRREHPSLARAVPKAAIERLLTRRRSKGGAKERGVLGHRNRSPAPQATPPARRHQPHERAAVPVRAQTRPRPTARTA